MRPSDVPPSLVEAVERLHASIDGSVRRLAVLHERRLQCRLGCHGCCIDDLTVSIAEAARILRDHDELLAAGEPGPLGGCAMLDGAGGCRIYASRPYVCRTQGLPLRWIEDDDEGGVERRDICPMNDPPASAEITALEALPPGACWTLGAAERALATLDDLAGGGGHRVALRALFGLSLPSSSTARGPRGEPERGLVIGADRPAEAAHPGAPEGACPASVSGAPAARPTDGGASQK